MNKQQPKVMVGQTWVNKEISTYSVRVGGLINDLVQLSHSDGAIATVYLARFYELYTFVPADVVEHMAVTISEWSGDKSEAVSYPTMDKLSCVKISYDTWFNMRVHLGLETNAPTTEEIDMLTKPGEPADYTKPEGVFVSPLEFGAIADEDGKPVFTQDQADSGELPPVGFRCEFEFYLNSDTDWMGCYVIGDTEDGKCIVIHDDEDNLHFAFKDNGSIKFRPIDTRTDQEKLVDSLVYLLERSPDSLKNKAEYLIRNLNVSLKDK